MNIADSAERAKAMEETQFIRTSVEKAPRFFARKEQPTSID